MINADKLIESLRSKNPETKDAAIKMVRALGVSDRNELFIAAKKHGGVASLFTYLTGKTAPTPPVQLKKQVPISKSLIANNQDINQVWANRSIKIIPTNDNLYDKNISVGIVVGTFAAVPYIHLQLEARKRLYPDIPLLVHDDCSKQSKEIELLCDRYGCDFEYNSVRQPACLGDITAFVGGLKWASEKKLDILVKISRRWIWTVDWVPNFINLAHKSQYATFSNITVTFGFGFRTECIGMSVKSWATPYFYKEFFGLVSAKKSIFVEGYIHKLSKELEANNCSKANNFKSNDGFARWDLMGDDRVTASKGKRLWHDSHNVSDYFNLSKKWGLPYKKDDFLDPNQGQGRE